MLFQTHLLSDYHTDQMKFFEFFAFSIRNEDSPVKRGPGRPRKRKNCSNSKSTVNNDQDASPANSPSADQIETRSPSPEATPAEDLDEEVEDEKCEAEPAEVCEDKDEEKGTEMVTEEELEVRFSCDFEP